MILKSLFIYTPITMAVLVILFFKYWPALGDVPDENNLGYVGKSPNYDKSRGQFVNRRPDVLKQMQEESMDLSLALDWFKAAEGRVPKSKLPEVKPDFQKFLEVSKKPKVIWFGHSSFLLRINGQSILVDPVFSNSASPLSFLVTRFQKPVVDLKELPPIDIVLISHDHYDHLDMETIKYFKGQKTQFVVPLGVSSHLKSWGITEKQIVELDWWETFRWLEGIDFIATPAQHFSGRDGINHDKTLWASWVIKTENSSLYFSGDSGYDLHFKEIGDRYGPFDLAFIESGQYNEKWFAVHLMPKHFVQAALDLKAKKYLPVHWGMFELAFHSWKEPIDILYEKHLKDEIQLVAPKIGEVVNLNEERPINPWWKDLL